MTEPTNDPEIIAVTRPTSAYLPTDQLRKYFDGYEQIQWLDEGFFNRLFAEEQLAIYKDLISRLGINTIPQIIEVKRGHNPEVIEAFGLNHIPILAQHQHEVNDKELAGLNNAVTNLTVDRSVAIIKCLVDHAAKAGSFTGFCNNLKGNYHYVTRVTRSYVYTADTKFDSSIMRTLTDTPWLYNHQGVLHKPSDISLNDLDGRYFEFGKEAENILELFGLKIDESLKNLTQSQRIAYDLGCKLQEQGIDLNDRQLLDELIGIAKARKKAKNNGEPEAHSLFDDLNNTPLPASDPITQEILRIASDIKSRRDRPATNTDPNRPHPPTVEPTVEEREDEDRDEFIQPRASTADIINRRRDLAAVEIEELTRIDILCQAVQTAERYSMAWFKGVLELEYLKSSESNYRDREISIQFTKVDRDAEASSIIILRNPSRYIPHNIEDIGDLSIRIYGRSESRSVSVEVVNVREYTLRAKLANSIDLQGFNLGEVTRAVVTIKNPVFLIEELQKAFNSLKFDPTYNLRDHLTSRIEFVFGPPGTGKTTHLAREVLIRLMKRSTEIKILVLTPTNKAADVLARRVIEIMDESKDDTYHEWLLRYGPSGEALLDQEGIVIEKDFDIRTRPHNVVITTVARFAYDGFKPEGVTYPLHLRELQWDYIVFDEASMINLASVVFPLYHKVHESQFIIAGDPFQIPPVTLAEEWKDENIYTMVGLNDFAEPKTVPHVYPITNLTTQYRSVPAIGEVFSQFTYKGILAHNRTTASRRPLQIDGLPLTDVNIITFPVNGNDSVFRSQRLNSTPYHIYSALFTFELAKYIARQIEENHSEFYRIGVICPYRAQANIIQKLVATITINPKKVEIQVGTIHGFQGDQCHIVISLFNPPPSISGNPNIFLIDT